MAIKKHFPNYYQLLTQSDYRQHICYWGINTFRIYDYAVIFSMVLMCHSISRFSEDNALLAYR